LFSLPYIKDSYIQRRGYRDLGFKLISWARYRMFCQNRPLLVQAGT
jgi:hypothetical protein